MKKSYDDQVRMGRWTDPIPLWEGGGAWVFPERAVIYTQSRHAIPVEADAHLLFDFFHWLNETVPTHLPPTIIHDWRSMRSVPRETRTAFIRRRKQFSIRPKRVVLAVEMNPMLRMALRTIALGAQLIAQTVDLDLVDDPEPELEKLALGEPDASLHARLRLAWHYVRSLSPGKNAL